MTPDYSGNMRPLCVASNFNAAFNEEAVTWPAGAATAGADQGSAGLQWLLSWTEVGLSQLAYVYCILSDILMLHT